MPLQNAVKVTHDAIFSVWYSSDLDRDRGRWPAPHIVRAWGLLRCNTVPDSHRTSNSYCCRIHRINSYTESSRSSSIDCFTTVHWDSTLITGIFISSRGPILLPVTAAAVVVVSNTEVHSTTELKAPKTSYSKTRFLVYQFHCRDSGLYIKLIAQLVFNFIQN